MGCIRADAAAQCLVEAGASALMSFGMAGGLDPALIAGSVVLPREVIAGDGARFPTSAQWRESLAAAVGPQRRVSDGALLSRQQAIDTAADKAAAFRDTGAVAVDMESPRGCPSGGGSPCTLYRRAGHRGYGRGCAAANGARCELGGSGANLAPHRRRGFGAGGTHRRHSSDPPLRGRDAHPGRCRGGQPPLRIGLGRASGMKALVTGATGFVGAAVARALLQAGWQVRVLVRPGSDRGNLKGLAVEVAEGDLGNVPSLELALGGCTGLFHAAADYRLGARDPSSLYVTNVDGTRNILRAAQRAGLARVVYTSSVATIGIPRDGSPGVEQTAVSVANMIGHYKRSKFLAEEVARESARSGLSVVIVNPSTPVGPGDVKPTPTGQLILDAASGRMPAYVDTGLNVVHVDDVCRGSSAGLRTRQSR